MQKGALAHMKNAIPLSITHSNTNREQLQRLSKQQAVKRCQILRLSPCNSIPGIPDVSLPTPLKSIQHSQAGASLITSSAAASSRM